jgi:hypothetical protein
MPARQAQGNDDLTAHLTEFYNPGFILCYSSLPSLLKDPFFILNTHLVKNAVNEVGCTCRTLRAVFDTK